VDLTKRKDLKMDQDSRLIAIGSNVKSLGLDISLLSCLRYFQA